MAGMVRVGMIGTSWWMDLAHLPMLKTDDRVVMAAICGRNRDRAQEMGGEVSVRERGVTRRREHDPVAARNAQGLELASCGNGP